MSTSATELADRPQSSEDEHEHEHGTSDRKYFMIFWVLVVLTALEVSTEWWDDWFGEGSRRIAVPLLIILMIVKFFLVALYFMHLKFDNAMLRRIFWFGAIVAIAVYTVALSAMHFWQDSGVTRYNDPPPVSANPLGGTEAGAEPGAGSGGSTHEGSGGHGG
jgi:cytochrome c oxidase subunit IV